MPGDAWVGGIEPDAVPGAVRLDRRFQEVETAANALPGRPDEGIRGKHGFPFGCGGANRRRGVVHRLLEKLQRGRAGSRFLAFGLAAFAARRKYDMRGAVGLFVNVDSMVFGERYAEFALDGLFGVRDKPFAKVAVLGGPPLQDTGKIKGFLHSSTPNARVKRPVF